MSIQSKGAALASIAAVLALSASPVFAAAHSGAAPVSEKVHCFGVTSCKGTSDCKSAENACKGMNACKGHGFKAMTSSDCKAKGGTTEEKKAK